MKGRFGALKVLGPNPIARNWEFAQAGQNYCTEFKKKNAGNSNLPRIRSGNSRKIGFTG